MKCLENYIGLLGCSNEAPKSGLYINDFDGMSNELLNAIATPDQPSYIQLWESVQRIAFEEIKSTVRNHLYNYTQAEAQQALFSTERTMIFDRQLIQPCEPEAKWKGIFLSAFGSKFLAFKVKSVWVYNTGSAVQDVPLKVFSTFDWSVVYETTIDVPTGFSQIEIDKTFDLQFRGLNLFLALDASDLSLINNPFVQSDYWWNVAMSCPRANDWNYSEFEIYPVSMPLDVAFPDKIQYDWNQTGIMFEVDLICSIEAFICANRDYLKLGIGYALAERILNQKLAGTNQNFMATFNPENTIQIRDMFKAKKEKEFREWAKIVNINGEDICFSCEDAMLVKIEGSL
jgi:hypothetical protein